MKIRLLPDETLVMWGGEFGRTVFSEGTQTHAAPPQAELISVKTIRDRAPHNGFTDLVRFRDQLFCCFREGLDHVGGEGVILILSSKDGEQ